MSVYVGPCPVHGMLQPPRGGVSSEGVAVSTNYRRPPIPLRRVKTDKRQASVKIRLPGDRPFASADVAFLPPAPTYGERWKTLRCLGSRCAACGRTIRSACATVRSRCSDIAAAVHARTGAELVQLHVHIRSTAFAHDGSDTYGREIAALSTDGQPSD